MLENIKVTQHVSWRKAKTALALFLPLTLLTAILMVVLYRKEVKPVQNDLKRQAVQMVNLQKYKISNSFDLISADLLFLTGHTHLLDMLATPSVNRDEFAYELAFFSRINRVYDQVRVLDSGGMELIRVNLLKGSPLVVPDDQLQFKGNRYYFKETFSLGKGEVFISPLDLNIEHDRIEQPPKPMIRFGTPVFDRAGRKRGILIFNYLAGNLIRNLKEATAGSLGQYMLLNQDGYWLIGGNADEEWGFMYENGKQKTMGNKYPEAWRAIRASDTGQFLARDGLFTFATVHPLHAAATPGGASPDAATIAGNSKIARNYTWKVVSFIPEEVFNAKAGSVRNKYGFIFIISLVVLAIGSWFVAEKVFAGRRKEKYLLQEAQFCIEHAAIGVFQIDEEGRITYVNSHACRTLGYSREELVALTVFDIDPTFSRERWLTHRKGVYARGSGTIETLHRRKDGTLFPVEVTVSYMEYEGKPFSFSFAYDISERKRAEEEIRAINAGLEQRVEARTRELEETMMELEVSTENLQEELDARRMAEDSLREITAELTKKNVELERSRTAMQHLIEDINDANKQLEKTNQKLKEIDRLKSLFIASMSHELRTPLNSVIGFSSILLHEWIGPLNDEQKNTQAAILRSGKHLLSLINDVIDVSKVEAGKIEISIDDFDLADLLAEVEQSFAKEARDRRLSLIVPEFHVSMRTDRRRLLQCLLNLVSNAIKFTEQGEVKVVVRHNEERGELTIAVTDTGIGIGLADQAQLFQAFYRVHSLLSAKAPGTGLGLYLTKKIIVEIMRGAISVTSELGSGSAFSITIPSRIKDEQK